MTQASAPTRAINVLTDAGIDFRTIEYTHSPDARSFGEEAAQQLSVEPSRTFKTLIVHLHPDEYVVAVVPVSSQLSLKLLAKAAGAKNAELADPKVAERRTGYVIGGISPLGQRNRHRLFIDASCQEHESIIVSGGKRGLSVELSPDDLVRLSTGVLADLQSSQ